MQDAGGGHLVLMPLICGSEKPLQIAAGSRDNTIGAKSKTIWAVEAPTNLPMS
jgi:hypothetical protein